MRNTDLISQRLEKALEYLYEQDTKLKPLLEYLQDLIVREVHNENLTVREAFEMFLKIQEQYTNSIVLISKIKEIIDFKD